METNAKIWIAALRRSHDELAGFLDTLDGKGLRQQSACSEWNVAQVLGHLGSGAELALGGFEAALAGGEPPGPETFPPVWERWNAMSPEAAAAEFRVADERHVAAVEALDDDTLTNLRMKFVFLPEPVDVATAVALRLSEHTHHSWDVFVAFRPDATLAPSGTELLIDQVGTLLPFLAKPEALGPREGPLVLDIATERPSRRFALHIADTVTLAEGDAVKADGMVALPAESLLRLIFGRLDESHTPDAVSVSGPLSLDDLRKMFPGL